MSYKDRLAGGLVRFIFPATMRWISGSVTRWDQRWPHQSESTGQPWSLTASGPFKAVIRLDTDSDMARR